MKKLIWIISILILLPGLNLNAQKINYGIQVGFDVANAQLTNKPSIEGRLYYPMVAFNANGYIGYKSAGFWGVSMEPGFIEKGGIIKDSDHDTRVQLNYVQMPVLADIYFSNKLFLSVGPEIAYMINAKAKYSGSSNDISPLYSNKFELSGLIGINYKIMDKLDIGLRYNHGITYTYKIDYTDQNGNTTGQSKDYNQYFQIILRFRI